MIPVRSQWGRYNLPRYLYHPWVAKKTFFDHLDYLFKSIDAPLPAAASSTRLGGLKASTREMGKHDKLFDQNMDS